MSSLDILRRRLEEQHSQPEPLPKADRFFISKEQIVEFFETTVLPAFQRIKSELERFPLRAYVYRHSIVARILVKDATTGFSFGVSIDNPGESVQIYFSYTENYRISSVKAADYPEQRIEIVCETVGLREYKKITEEHLIALFTRFYFERNEIAVKTREDGKIAFEQRIEAAIEKWREIERMDVNETEAEEF